MVEKIRKRVATPKGFLLYAAPFWMATAAIAFYLQSGVGIALLLNTIIISTAYLPLRWHHRPMDSAKAFLVGTTIRLAVFGVVALYVVAHKGESLTWLISPVVAYFGTISVEFLFLIFQKKGEG